MTVIAYSSAHKMMAADSRMTHGGMPVTTCQKIYRLRSGALLGLSGDGDARDFLALVKACRPDRLPARYKLAALECEVQGLLAFPSGEVFYLSAVRAEYPGGSEWGGEVVEIKDPFFAIGSGLQFAYGALEAGASPKQAVEIACRRDVFCAPPVQYETFLKPRKNL